MPLIVLDTNVLISALVFGGKPRHLLEMCLEGQYVSVTSEELFTEFRRTIRDKFPTFAPEAAALEAILREHTLIVPLGSVTITVARDADGNKVLETAVLGQAAYVVTGDRDLLTRKKYRGIIIVPPNELV